MKITASIVASLLASVAVARPRAMEKGDPLPQRSRITAFVVGEDGRPSVECWSITNIVDEEQINRADGSKATAYALPLASSELDGVDILTWPALSPIWPPPDDTARSDGFDLANHFSLFTVQGGLINFNVNFRLGSNDNDEDEIHIFSMENGDDWFYFEDNYSGSALARSANAKPNPFIISTISGTETELLRLKYNAPPKHTAIHKGACSFTGIKFPAESSPYGAKTSRVHSPLTVQVHIEDSL